MSRSRYETWTCDGCGHVETVAPTAIPDGWHCLAVAPGDPAWDASWVRHHICAECSEGFHRHMSGERDPGFDPVGGFMWCRAHDDIADECGDAGGDVCAAAHYKREPRNDGEPCRLVSLWISAEATP